MRRLLLILGILLALPIAVAGDVPAPAGKKYVSRDIILEVGEEARNYRFWLKTYRRGHDKPETTQLLALAPGQPCRITGRGRGVLIGIPQTLVFQMGEGAVADALVSHKDLPGLIGVSLNEENPESPRNQMWQSPFATTISASDSRECVVERYRMEIDDVNGLRLVYLGDNSWENTTYWLYGALVVTGVFISGLAIWLGLRIARRRQQTQPAPQ